MVNFSINSQEQTNIIGTWHPNGYHGHHRSKSRGEFSTMYRQYAKPPQPEKFIKRVTSDATKHTFSHHDNKQAFLNDAMLFGSGLGKKKIESRNKSKWNPEFIAWAHQEKNTESVPKSSIYQHDFCSYLNNSKLLTGRKQLEVKQVRPVSTYEYMFNHGEPSSETSKLMRLETFQRYVSRNRNKTNISIGERSSVASCLVWQDHAKVEQQQQQQELSKERPKTVMIDRTNFD